MVVVDVQDRHTMEAADMSRTRGTTEVPITIVDPPRGGGVKVAPRAGKIESSTTTIVARRAIGKANVGRRRPIQTKANQAEPMDNKNRSTQRSQGKLEWDPHSSRSTKPTEWV